MPYVTGAAILDAAGVANPAPADEDWADTVAERLEAIILKRMEDVPDFATDDGITAELTHAALLDGLAGYAERKAPHGVLTIGDGDVTRLGRDITRALEPVFMRYAGPGIG